MKAILCKVTVIRVEMNPATLRGGRTVEVKIEGDGFEGYFTTEPENAPKAGARVSIVVQ